MIPSQEWIRLTGLRTDKPIAVHLPLITMMESCSELDEVVYPEAHTMIWFGEVKTPVRESLDDIFKAMDLRR